MPDQPQKLELIIQGKMKWGEYKKIASDKTSFDERVTLIEKHIRVAQGEIDDVPFEDVMAALQKLTQVEAKKLKRDVIAYLWTGGVPPLEYVEVQLLREIGGTLQQLRRQPAEDILQILECMDAEAQVAKAREKRTKPKGLRESNRK